MDDLYVDVILPLHIPSTYTYRVPGEYVPHIQVGQRVVVQFGQRRLYSALVRAIHTNKPSVNGIKYINAIIDPQPIVNEKQFELWEWIARYYMCYVGDVMAAALPSAFRMASQSTVCIHPGYTGEINNLSKNEVEIVHLLTSHSKMSINDISRALGIQKVMPIINTMIEKEIIIMDEDLRQRFSVKKSTWLSLAQQYKESEDALRQLFDKLELNRTTQKQVNVLIQFLQLSNNGKEAIAKRQMEQSSSLKTLIKNDVLVEEERTESRLGNYEMQSTPESIQLSDEQQAAYDALSNSESNISLLHGVTSSGKTEVYIKLINKCIQEGKQALFLLPEIALTTQIIYRLRKFFGNKVGVYHSRFTANQRAEIWQRTITPDSENEYKLIVGARSALFLPFKNLGLVIVDEEHDNSYKQNEPLPRYNGRDTALYLARLHGAKAILGSATPSLECYYNSKNGRYQLVEITKRYGGLLMPEILCVDMKEASRKNEVNGHFSRLLIEHIQEALEAKQQVILFQNRRGFSVRLECNDCHWIPQCNNCDVSLVYHKGTNNLRCHYCGYQIPVPKECPHCHSTRIGMRGLGTERVEDDIQILFPDAKITRMDLDSTSQANSYLNIINDFEERKIDILIGTQMVTKGLDFDNVGVVGILSADNLINFPDFRSYERAFQLMTQVSGRAGRHGTRGKVIIQTYNPYHQAIRNVVENDYASMYSSQINERRVFNYPPFSKIIEITLKHRDAELLRIASRTLAQQLQYYYGTRVIGPETPNVGRIRGLYLKKIMIRFARTEAIGEAKLNIQKIAGELLADKQYKSALSIQFDVDPQ